MKWDGKELKKIGDSAAVQHVSLDRGAIILIDKGQAYHLDTAGKERKLIDLSDKIQVDLQKLSAQKFNELARGGKRQRRKAPGEARDPIYPDS